MKETRTQIPAIVIVLAVLMFMILFASLWNYGPFGDEFYYIDCSRHLAAGYVDHPPLVAFVALAVRKLFGTAYIALRVVSALAAAATVMLTALLAKRLGGGRFAQSMAALTVTAAPGLWAIFSFYSMNPFDIVIVSIAILVLIDILRGRTPWLWVGFGTCVGVGLMNKLTLLPFGFAVLFSILITSHRRKLLTPWPWVAAGIAALIFLPNIIWQLTHGWPTVEFISHTQQYIINQQSAGEYLLQLVLSINPVVAPLWIGSIAYFLSGRPRKVGRVLGILAVMFITVYVTLRSKVYYVYPMIPLLMAAGSVALEWLTINRVRIKIRPIAVVLIAATGLTLLPIGAPVLPIEWFIPYGKATGILDNLKIHQQDRIDLPVHFALRFGWREMVQNVSYAFNSLSDVEKEECIIIADDYSKAGAINYYRKEYGLPEAISGHNSYRYWLPENLQLKTVIAIGIEERFLKHNFSDVQLFRVHRHPYAALWETDEELFIARDPARSWRQIRNDMHWY